MIKLSFHQSVHEMDDGDAGARLGQPIGRLEPEKAAADDDHAPARGFARRDGVDVVDVAKGEDARQFHAGDAELDWLRARGKDELGKRKLLAAGKGDGACVRIDRGRTHAVAQCHAAVAPPSFRLELDVGEADFFCQQCRQQHPIVGEPRLLADHGDGMAAERALRQLFDETRRGHAVADDDERLAHRFPSRCGMRCGAPAAPCSNRSRGGGSGQVAIVSDGDLVVTISSYVPIRSQWFY